MEKKWKMDGFIAPDTTFPVCSNSTVCLGKRSFVWICCYPTRICHGCNKEGTHAARRISIGPATRAGGTLPVGVGQEWGNFFMKRANKKTATLYLVSEEDIQYAQHYNPSDRIKIQRGAESMPTKSWEGVDRGQRCVLVPGRAKKGRAGNRPTCMYVYYI